MRPNLTTTTAVATRTLICCRSIIRFFVLYYSVLWRKNKQKKQKKHSKWIEPSLPQQFNQPRACGCSDTPPILSTCPLPRVRELRYLGECGVSLTVILAGDQLPEETSPGGVRTLLVLTCLETQFCIVCSPSGLCCCVNELDHSKINFREKNTYCNTNNYTKRCVRVTGQ